jgi:acyl carrier protein
MVDDRFKDALYMLRILMAVENEFDIIIQDTEVEFINTFEDLINLIQEKENDINKGII